MKVSIVLCSYNGEKYIEEQLDSLRVQTRAADEVIIFDYRSTDRTVKIVQDFIRKYELSGWSIEVNSENKGWKRNFMEGMQKASGDLIFPCDQDDVWMRNKIEKMSEIIEKNNNILLLTANYKSSYVCGEGYRKVSNVFTRRNRDDESVWKIEADKKGLYIMRPGCVMAFRRELLDLCLRYCFDEYPHDALLWRTAVIAGGLYRYEYPCIVWRRHEDNASGQKEHQVNQRLENICYYHEVCDKLIQLAKDKGDQEKLVLLKKIKKFWILRKHFYETRSIRDAVILMTRYLGYYLTLKMALGDLYIVMRNK